MVVEGAGECWEEEWAPDRSDTRLASISSINNSNKCRPTARHLKQERPVPLKEGGEKGEQRKREEEDQDQWRAVGEMREDVQSIRPPLLSAVATESPAASQSIIHRHQLESSSSSSFNVSSQTSGNDYNNNNNSNNKVTECHFGLPLPLTTQPAYTHCSELLFKGGLPAAALRRRHICRESISVPANSSFIGSLKAQKRPETESVADVKVELNESEAPHNKLQRFASSGEQRREEVVGCAGGEPIIWSELTDAGSMRGQQRCRKQSKCVEKPKIGRVLEGGEIEGIKKKKKRKPSERSKGRPLSRRAFISHTGSMCPSWRELALFMLVSVVVTSILASLSLTNSLPLSTCFFMKHCHALATESTPQPPLLQQQHQQPPETTGASSSGKQQPVVISNESSNLQSRLDQQTPDRSPLKGPAVTTIGYQASVSQAPESREEASFEDSGRLMSVEALKVNSSPPQQPTQTINHRTDLSSSNNSTPPTATTGLPHNHRASVGKLLSFNVVEPQEDQLDNQQHQFAAMTGGSSQLYPDSRLEPLARAADTKPKSEVSFAAPPPEVGPTRLQHQPSQASKQAKFVPLVPIAQAASSSSNAIKVIAAPSFADPQHLRDWGARAVKRPAAANNATNASGPQKFTQTQPATADSTGNMSKSYKDTATAKHTQALHSPTFDHQQKPTRQHSLSAASSPIVAEPPLDTSFILTNNIPELSQFTYLSDLLSATPTLGPTTPALPLVGMHHSSALMSPAQYYQQHPASSSVYTLNAASPLDQHSLKQLVSIGRAQAGLRQPNRPLVSVSSASAPSVSLPPITHFLAPRNPFRLFSSSSSTSLASTRYRPSFLVSSREHLKQQQSGGFRQRLRQPTSYNANYYSTTSATQSANNNNNYAGWAGAQMQHQQHPLDVAAASVSKAFQGHAKLAALDPHDTKQLYAHARSVEQLEQLIRAASQLDGVRSPILPAIVSASSGQTFPGLYIPAIEGADGESQIQEIRQASQERLPLGATMAVAYKIPGTDYILHPEEVKAMMSIGENAWRESSQNQVSPSDHVSSSTQTTSSTGQPLRELHGRFMDGWRKKNHLRENHAQNIRDFAYVDPPVIAAPLSIDQVPVPSSDSLLQTTSTTSSSPSKYPMNITQYVLGPLLSQQVRYGSFPPFIRLHNQDYVRWQLIGGRDLPTNNKPLISHSPHLYWAPESSPVSSAGPLPYRHTAEPASNGFPMQTSSSSTIGSPQQVPPILLASSSATSGSSAGAGDITNENSPIRLATQLTPSEISQVEDSILEALLVSQQLERQQHLMRVAAAASVNPFYLRPVSVQLSPLIPQQPQVRSPQEQSKTTSQKRVRKGGGLFKRRRERKSSMDVEMAGLDRDKKNKNKMKKQSSIPAELLTTSATNQTTMTLALASLYSPPARVQLMGSPVMESVMIESKLGPHLNLPLLVGREKNQENIKPLSWNSMSSLVGEASAGTKLHKRYLMQPDDIMQPSSSRQSRHVMAANGDRSIPERAHCDDEEPSSFGSRVGSTGGCKQQTVKPKPHRQSSTSRHQSTSSASQRTNYPEGWPSDADYFPDTLGNSLNQQHQPTTIRPQVVPPAVLRQSTQQASSSRLSMATDMGRGRGHFLPSQLKLQFSQDYQAREGVPIYNNNVRAAGALDRPPTMVALMDSRRRATSRLSSPTKQRYPTNNKPTSSHRPSPAREPAASEDDEMQEDPDDQADESSSSAAHKPEEDLWLKGSSPAGSKAANSQVNSLKKPAKQ